MTAQCEYYGNIGTNLSASYCQNDATWDLGRYLRQTGLPYEVRYSCDEHASRLIPFRIRKHRENTPSEAQL